MKSSLYSPPNFIKQAFSSFIWDSVSDKILLTFDDGPTELLTTKILEKLKKYNIKALFFCVGENVLQQKELVREIIGEGHQIGCHTMKHQNVTRKKALVREDISLFITLLEDEFNFEVKYFRPPHGRFRLNTKNILKEYSLKCVMWNLLSVDYKNDLNIVKFAIDNYLKKNSIVVLHDNSKSEDVVLDSIDYIYEIAQNNGYNFGEPFECLK